MLRLPEFPKLAPLFLVVSLTLLPQTTYAQNQGLEAPRGTPSQSELATRLAKSFHNIATPAQRWFSHTPPIERVTWAGLAACALLAFLTCIDRLRHTQRERVLPSPFFERVHNRLLKGSLDYHQGLDYCELHPSPAARIALSAIKRSSRPVLELERSLNLAKQAEIRSLTRNTGTLRRIACLSPLIGLLGALASIQNSLENLPANAAWEPLVAASLLPLMLSIGLAILSLLAYDGIVLRTESLSADLEKQVVETLDAIAATSTSATTMHSSTRAGHGLTSRPEPPQATPPAPLAPTQSIRRHRLRRFTSRRTRIAPDDLEH